MTSLKQKAWYLNRDTKADLDSEDTGTTTVFYKGTVMYLEKDVDLAVKELEEILQFCDNHEKHKISIKRVFGK